MLKKMVDENQGLFTNLYARWQDEKEYEDINDYGKVIEKALPEGFQFIQMAKRPFGFKFSFDGDKYHLTVSETAIRVREI